MVVSNRYKQHHLGVAERKDMQRFLLPLRGEKQEEEEEEKWEEERTEEKQGRAKTHHWYFLSALVGVEHQ